jgi:hypothetical protein
MGDGDRRMQTPLCASPASSTPTLGILATQNTELVCSPAAEQTPASKHAMTCARAENNTTTTSIAPRGLYHATAFAAMADFDLFTGDFQFTDFNNFGPNPLLDPSMQGLSQPQPNIYALPPNFASPTSATSPLEQSFDQASKKRKLDLALAATHESLDESVRGAAEEDKRRRNTAASARFRVKKKQREQALEQTAKEMQDRAARLEQKVQQLETENAWLKGLITEKSGGKHTTTDLKALLTKHEEASGRSSSTHTDGVGTKA